MLESNKRNCLDIVVEIRKLNTDIDRVLAMDGPIPEADIDAIDTLMNRRGTLLPELHRLILAVSEGSEATDRQTGTNFWNSFSTELMISDKNRLALLQNKVDLAAETLRNTMKNKSLLQYQRSI